ncbi:MAG: hypothetical protein QY332_14000 [Anaerolineales bacterium]|nr:MAG: hypothetical protein QY332_14000 [Anaerolineales bacterium]
MKAVFSAAFWAGGDAGLWFLGNFPVQKLIGLIRKLIGLKPKFIGLISKFVGLKPKFVGLKPKFVGLKSKFVGLISRLSQQTRPGTFCRGMFRDIRRGRRGAVVKGGFSIAIYPLGVLKLGGYLYYFNPSLSKVPN